MKTYFIGNQPIKSCFNYLSKDKTKKAERIFTDVIAKFNPDCKQALNTSFWAVEFKSNTQIIEIAGFKIACGKYLLRPNTYLFAFINEK